MVSVAKLSASVHSVILVMTDEDVINCLPDSTITPGPGQIMDTFTWVPCIFNIEASIVAKEEETFSLVN